MKSNSVKCSLWLKVAASIKKPHLCFSQHKRCGHFKAFGSGQVFVKLELVLQLQQLLTGESGAGPPALSQQAGLRARCSAQDRDTVVWGENSSAVTTQVTQSKTFFFFFFFGWGEYCPFYIILKWLPIKMISEVHTIWFLISRTWEV